MLDNQTRRELLSKARQSGFPGSILDVFAAYEQGRDLVAEFQQQQEQQQTQQMSEAAAQQSGMQMPQQMQQGQEQPQQGPPPPQGPPQGLPQGSNIPQPPPENTGLVNSNEAQGTGMASNASGRLGGQEILAMGGFREDDYNKFSTHFPFSKEQRGTIAHNATVERPDLTMVQGKKYVFGGLKYKAGGFKYENGGPGDPPVIPANPAADQPFSQHYQDNAADFNAADSAARSYMTDWFSKRAEAFPEKHGEAANAMGSYLQNSAQSAYVPAGTEFKGVKGTADAYGFANEPDYRVSLDQTTATKALSDNPFSFPESGGKIKGSNAPLNYNTAYYIGEGGKMPTTHLEEQLHSASNYGEYMSNNHAGSFKRAGEYINAEAIGKMGYPGVKGNEDYYGDTQEFYPRLMSARRTFGLDPAKKYTSQEMSGFLDKGYNDLIKGNLTEPGQKEHLIEFYQQLGYPTPSAGFTKGASEEEIRLQKEAAAEKFRKSNDEFAMQKNKNSGDYPPLISRYGGYRTRR